MTVSPNEVAQAYRLILGREPENDAVFQTHRAHTVWSLIKAMIESPEFIARRFPVATDSFPFIRLDRPAQRIDIMCSTADLDLLWAKVRETWEALGLQRP